jgi:hypothetical protein
MARAVDDFLPDSSGGTSRRRVLRRMAAAPIAAPVTASPWAKALTALHDRYEDTPVLLRRSREGRRTSRDRYHSAQIAFMGIEAGFFADARHIRTTLHQAGAVAKLALCAHLLDVGFADEWNAEYIRQDITKTLAMPMRRGSGMTARRRRDWRSSSRLTGNGAIAI